jgi:hypothetical protein
MKRDDWILLSLTFLTGLAIGMYIYIAAFKPTYAPESLNNTESNASDWSMIGKRRGGDHDDRYIQPSFRLLGTGEYVYLPGGVGDGALSPEKGSLAKSQLNSLLVSEAELASYSRGVSASICASDRGGYDYEYRVTVDGETVILDTCLTSLGNTEMADKLEVLWQQMGGNGVTGGSGQSFDRPSEWIQDWIRQNLGFE